MHFLLSTLDVTRNVNVSLNPRKGEIVNVSLISCPSRSKYDLESILLVPFLDIHSNTEQKVHATRGDMLLLRKEGPLLRITLTLTMEQ